MDVALYLWSRLECQKYTEQQLTDLAQSKNIRLKLDLDYRNSEINGKPFVVINETVAYKALEANK